MLNGKLYSPLQSLGGTSNAYQVVAVTTNGTTPVNVFSLPLGVGMPSITITSIKSIAEDTTAGNITLTNAGNTIAVIAKGVTAGAVVGGFSLSNTKVLAGGVLQVVSSSAGNSIVEVVFTVNS
jgi:hypothetical protein